jgi:hypothetical protein
MPTPRRDRFINRYRGRLTTNSDATSAAYESFNTGMNVGRTDPMKWVITHFAMWPNLVIQAYPYAATGDIVKVQLCIGNQTAILNGDDMQVICEGSTAQVPGADATAQRSQLWPIQGYLPAPVPVFAQSLTVLIDALTNQTGMQSKEFVYEIGYVQAPISQDEIVEYLSAFGQV